MVPPGDLYYFFTVGDEHVVTNQDVLKQNLDGDGINIKVKKNSIIFRLKSSKLNRI